jgi:hypothetical protein
MLHRMLLEIVARQVQQAIVPPLCFAEIVQIYTHEYMYIGPTALSEY